MITEEEKNIIRRCAEKYQVKEVFLFGSSLGNPDEANDIDLAVRGIKPALFFRFYGDLFFLLSKPVDLVPLDIPTPFTEYVFKHALRIYG
ncbi:MAG: nucleotidyltransferase domain-containing protein [Bacteroidetes bacterium]|nr:MAG: nucleotidyltransferase domain-containing protein [Bacteroidota bacterium]